jgi:hypothetical protein
VQLSPNRLAATDERHKQLYWGAFVLGSAAFHDHRRDGFWLSGPAVEELALQRFRRLRREGAPENPLFVDDWSSGLVCFTQGFAAGYRQRAEKLGHEGLTQRRNLPSQA